MEVVVGGESAQPTWVIVGAVVVGAIMVLVGFFARAINEEYTAFSHEIVPLDDGAVAVFESDREGDWPMWEVEVDESATDRAVVYRLASEGAVPEEVFVGTPDEAAAWALTRGRSPLFEGTESEAADWVRDQEDAAENGWTPVILIVGGAVVALAGISTGFRQRMGSRA